MILSDLGICNNVKLCYNSTMQLKTIAHIRNAYREKFGIPRQSGLTDIVSRIVFEKEYRDMNALRGLEGFSHLWLIWGFSKADDSFRPTVRPPRLGGNTRVGVFATRSPFRPNPVGISSVRLKGILETEEGPVIEVIGADILDGTPIYDIKPYIPYADCHPEATGGFTDTTEKRRAEVRFAPGAGKKLDEAGRRALVSVLKEDPRPGYQDDPERIYGFSFGGREVRFTVADGILTVIEC